MKKHWGDISLTKIKEAIEKAPMKRKTNQFDDALKVDATSYDDGNIGISVYNPDTKERIFIAKLMPSKY